MPACRGTAPHTAQQTPERFNRTLKQSLPASYHLHGLQEITARVESGLRAIAIENGFVRESDESLLFQPADPRVPPKALIRADWLQEPRDGGGQSTQPSSGLAIRGVFARKLHGVSSVGGCPGLACPADLYISNSAARSTNRSRITRKAASSHRSTNTRCVYASREGPGFGQADGAG